MTPEYRWTAEDDGQPAMTPLLSRWRWRKRRHCPVRPRSRCTPQRPFPFAVISRERTRYLSPLLKCDGDNFFTDADTDFVGPGQSHLTMGLTFDEGGGAGLFAADTTNVDPACVKLTDGSIIGCGGDFDRYPFTENRSVCACNGLVGDVDRWSCAMTTPGYLSARSWYSAGPPFGHGTGSLGSTSDVSRIWGNGCPSL